VNVKADVLNHLLVTYEEKLDEVYDGQCRDVSTFRDLLIAFAQEIDEEVVQSTQELELPSRDRCLWRAVDAAERAGELATHPANIAAVSQAWSAIAALRPGSARPGVIR